jgi:hypothetical protein
MLANLKAVAANYRQAAIRRFVLGWFTQVLITGVAVRACARPKVNLSRFLMAMGCAVTHPRQAARRHGRNR